MSELNINNELFLGNAELNRLVKFLSDDGYKKLLGLQVYSYGIVRDAIDIDASFKVEAGTVAGTIKIANDSYAIDSDVNIIKQTAFNNLAITDDGYYYYIRISHISSVYEEGLISVDTSGNMTGVGTKFLEVLRGMPDFPSKIRFYDSSDVLYATEYEVLEVIDDENAILQGDFTGGGVSGYYYEIVGTFTPGETIESTSKGIFKYDSCNLALVQGTAPKVSSTESGYTYYFPAVPVVGKYFYVAAVKNTGGVITIIDARSQYLFKLFVDKESDNFVKFITSTKFFDDFYNFAVGSLINFDQTTGELLLSDDGNIFDITLTAGSIVKYIKKSNTLVSSDFATNSLIFLKITSTGSAVKFAKTSAGGLFMNFPDKYVDYNVSGKWFVLRKKSTTKQWDFVTLNEFLSAELDFHTTRLSALETNWLTFTKAQILTKVGLNVGFTTLFDSVATGYYQYKIVRNIMYLGFTLDMRKAVAVSVPQIFIKLPDNYSVISDKTFKTTGIVKSNSSDPEDSVTYIVEITAAGSATYLSLSPVMSIQGDPGVVKHSTFISGIATSEDSSRAFTISGEIFFSYTYGTPLSD